jgi:hydroxypyruvate isomerase
MLHVFMFPRAPASGYNPRHPNQEQAMTDRPAAAASSRRHILKAATGLTAAAILPAGVALAADEHGHGELPDGKSLVATAGHVNHSVCLWCYKGMKSTDMAPVARRLGLKAIDLLTPKEWEPLKENGLICSMTSGVWGGITKGLNRREHHEPIGKTLVELADANAAAGYPNVICFSGNRDKQADDEGIKVCAEGIKKVIGHYEEKKITLCMELLNSKVDHADYQCDKSDWGIALCKAVGSERFKLLYDIYHMQIMEGDVIATIKKNHQYFAHYHTGGVPGRHEIDDTQELNWPAIMKAIVATGFKGYVAQEFIPAKPDMIASLAQAVKVCDV